MSEESGWTYVAVHLGLLLVVVGLVLLTDRWARGRGRFDVAGLDASGVAALVGYAPRLRQLAVVRAVVRGDIEVHPDGTATRTGPTSDDALAEQAARQADDHPGVPLLTSRGWPEPPPEIELDLLRRNLRPARDRFATALITVTAPFGVLTLAGVVFVVVVFASGAKGVVVSTLGSYVLMPTIGAWLWLHGRVKPTNRPLSAVAIAQLKTEIPTVTRLDADAADADYLPIALYGLRAWDDDRARYLAEPVPATPAVDHGPGGGEAFGSDG
ncbi:hypothetical protein [Actinokineospora globicatena]|uniref:hypothetical protein n=1 Tax=Actinokineospora globicatena TaxID=103729 RepID=UPI0020A3B882|nr:hypothetical protein [Actinokineospora globicatena]MCP2302512.1 hypothetical protein [Actinokineospora globicatena]GLW75803.1 hypothetical protein Aglo01_02850 [Actinokineospora globicatena]GLW82641.1 hypothetical protein Aglo02_02820 [Actinokineospora globicatena]